MHGIAFEVSHEMLGPVFRVELNPESMVSYLTIMGRRMIKFENVTLYYLEGDMVISSKPAVMPLNCVVATWNNEYEQNDIQSITVTASRPCKTDGNRHTTVKFKDGHWWCSCTKMVQIS